MPRAQRRGGTRTSGGSSRQLTYAITQLQKMVQTFRQFATWQKELTEMMTNLRTVQRELNTISRQVGARTGARAGTRRGYRRGKARTTTGIARAA